MTDTPEPNDIPAILARAEGWDSRYAFAIKMFQRALQLIEKDVPSMATEILSLRADKKRLDVLEELARTKRLFVDHVSIYISSVSNPYPTLTEAADAELLSRREKENG